MRHKLLFIAATLASSLLFGQGNTCATATTITPEDGSCTSPGYTNVGLTSIGDPIPSCWNSNPDNSAWFKFTATAGQVTINTNFTTLPTSITNTQLALFSGSCGALTEVICNEDIGPGNEMAGFTYYGLTVGQIYFVMVDGADGQTGDFNLCIENLDNPAPPAPGKDCDNATQLCDKSTSTFDPLAAGFGATDNTNSTCISFGEHQSTTVTFTVSTTGSLEFAIDPKGKTEYDWVLFNNTTGCPLGTSDDIACNYSFDGSSGSATGMGTVPAGATASEFSTSINVTAGNTYILLISNYDDDNSGFDLSWGGTSQFAGPKATFTVTPITGCAPLTVTTTNTSTSTTQYSWDFGDGSPVTSITSPSYTYTSGGNYIIELTAKGAGSCVVKDTALIKVTSPAASFVPSVVCNGNTTTLTNSSINATQFFWDYTSDGIIDATTTNASHLFPDGGTYNTTLIANNPTLGCSDTIVKKVTVTKPLFSFTPSSANICSGDTVDIISVLTPSPSLYQKAFVDTVDKAIPDAVTTTGGGPPVTTYGIMNDTITMSAISPATISASSEMEVCFTINHTKHSDIQSVYLESNTGVRVNYSPLPLNGSGTLEYCFSSTDLAGFNGVNANQRWILHIEDRVEKSRGVTNTGKLVGWNININTANTIQSYSWNPRTNMLNFTTLTPTVFPINSINYVLTATDATGCSGKDSVPVIVSAKDNPAFSLIDFCVGAPNSATILGTTGGSFSYDSTYTDGSSISASTGSISNGVLNQLYKVKYTTQGTCPDSSIEYVSVGSSDDASFSLASFCVGADNEAQISGSTGGTFKFKPAPLDGASINTSTGEISNPTANTTYTVLYKTPAGVCQDSSTQSVLVTGKDNAGFSIPDFCPGNSETATVTGVASGTFAFNIAPTDGASINASSGQISNGVAGAVYLVKYTTPSGACQADSVKTVSVKVLDNAAFTTTDFCVGSTNQVNITGVSGGNFYFDPTPVDGATLNTTTGVISNGVAGSSYSLVYSTNTVCPNTAIRTVSVQDIDNPFFNLANFCEGSDNQALNVITLGGTFSFEPNPTDGATLNPATGEISNETPGATYTIEYITSGTCPDSLSRSVFVNANTSAAFTMQNFCQGDSGIAVITGNTGGIFSVFPLPTDSTGLLDSLSGTLTNGVPGAIYYVQYKTLDANCPDSTTVEVSVETIPVVFGGIDTVICFGESIILHAIGDSASYEWDNDVEDSISFAPQNPDTNIYIVTASSGAGCMSTDTVIVIAETVNASFTTNSTTGPVPYLVSFTNQSTGAVSYKWVFEDGKESTETNPSYTFNELGDYTVSLEAYSENGCVSTYEVDLNAYNGCTFFIPTAFTPDGDSKNDNWVITCFESISEGSVKVFNRWGTEVYSSDGGANYTPWDGNGKNGKALPVGSYFFVVNTPEKVYNGTVTIIR